MQSGKEEDENIIQRGGWETTAWKGALGKRTWKGRRMSEHGTTTWPCRKPHVQHPRRCQEGFYIFKSPVTAPPSDNQNLQLPILQINLKIHEKKRKGKTLLNFCVKV